MKTTVIMCIFAIASWSLYACKANDRKLGLTQITDSLKVDPICKMKVKSIGTIKSTYKLKDYNFCNVACKKAFDKNPEKYIK